MVSECISFLLQLYSLMDMFPPHDILIGDSNCRFHGLTLSKRFSPDALHRYHQKCNLLIPVINSIPQFLSEKEFDTFVFIDSDFLRDAMFDTIQVSVL